MSDIDQTIQRLRELRLDHAQAASGPEEEFAWDVYSHALAELVPGLIDELERLREFERAHRFEALPQRERHIIRRFSPWPGGGATMISYDLLGLVFELRQPRSYMAEPDGER